MQLGLAFGLLALAGLVIVIGTLKAITRSKKITSYRYSKSGDDWILKYKAGKSKP